MLGSWFASKNNLAGDDEKARPSTEATATAYIPSPLPHDTKRQLQQQQERAPFANPHDAALADFYGLKDAEQNVGSISSTDAASQKEEEFHGPELLYDPFNGTSLGALIPGPTGVEQPADTENKELWTKLSKVLELQSEISMMHMDMEGIEAKTKKARTTERKGRKKWTRGVSATSEDDIDEVDAGVDKERERDIEEEFEDISDSFAGRKEAIDSIMNKLDDLSQALTKFHNMRTPALDLSRSNTQDNTGTATFTPMRMDSDISSPANRMFDKKSSPTTAVPMTFTRSAPAVSSTHVPASALPPPIFVPTASKNITSADLVNSPLSISTNY